MAYICWSTVTRGTETTGGKSGFVMLMLLLGLLIVSLVGLLKEALDVRLLFTLGTSSRLETYVPSAYGTSEDIFFLKMSKG